MRETMKQPNFLEQTPDDPKSNEASDEASERDCPCGNFPNGDCRICQTARGQTDYQKNLARQRRQSNKNEASEPPTKKLADFKAWQELKRRLGQK